MAGARLVTPQESRPEHRIRQQAFVLSRALPSLTAEARRLSANVVAGIHGRRRAGSGETFWQFRSFVPGEPMARIDWRRSARDDRITIRDREWEAAQTLWLWVDRSPSMQFVSDLAAASKIERAILIGLAAADMLVRGGERVGLMGDTPALATRAVIDRLAEAMLLSGQADAEFPPDQPLSPRSEAVIVSDFIAPLEDIRARLHRLAERRARGHLVAIADPVEETFPFSGHYEFTGTEPGLSMRIGDTASFAQAYRDRIAAHRDGLRRIARELGWTFLLHRTDRPATDVLLALRAAIESGHVLLPTGSAAS